MHSSQGKRVALLEIQSRWGGCRPRREFYPGIRRTLHRRRVDEALLDAIRISVAHSHPVPLCPILLYPKLRYYHFLP